jgi:hypothetical protein
MKGTKKTALPLITLNASGLILLRFIEKRCKNAVNIALISAGETHQSGQA